MFTKKLPGPIRTQSQNALWVPSAHPANFGTHMKITRCGHPYMAYICREVDENLRTFWDEFRSLLMKMYELFTPKNRAKILKWLPQLLDEDEFKTFVCEKVHGMYFCTYDEHVVITRHFMNIVNEDRLITSLKRNLDETGEIDMFWSELRDRYGEEESDVGMWIRRIDQILDEEET